MDSREEFSVVLAEFGSAMGIESLRLDEETGCTLGFDDQVVRLSYGEKDNSLIIFSALGPPPDRGRQALFQRLLVANLYREQLNDGALSYHEPSDRVVLVLRCPLDGMSLRKFHRIIKDFTGLAESWSRNIKGEGRDPEAAGDDTKNSAWLRV